MRTKIQSNIFDKNTSTRTKKRDYCINENSLNVLRWYVPILEPSLYTVLDREIYT